MKQFSRVLLHDLHWECKTPQAKQSFRVILQILNNPYSIFVACRVLEKGRQIHGFPPLIESVSEGVDGVWMLYKVEIEHKIGEDNG